MSKNDIKILVTGGHFTPALAVISELKKRGYSNFLWVGHKYNQTGNEESSPEFKAITSQKIKFIELKTGKITRKWTKQTFKPGIVNFLYIFIGFIKAFFIILRERPKVIASFGGYLAVPIVFWGRVLGVKILTHEQTITVGLANKIIAKFANTVCISWDVTKDLFKNKNVVLTGNPIRREVFAVRRNSLTKDLDSKRPTLFITGGNQGANEINKRIFEILPQLLQECNIIHQTGNSTVTNDYRRALDFQKDLAGDLMFRYVPVDFIGTEDIGDVFAKSDIIFSRAGANTISEIMAIGKLAILMPIPWTSQDEQTKNAGMVEETGLGYILPQKDNLSSQTVYQTVLLALNQFKASKGFNNQNLEKCKEIAKSKVILDAPSKVADEVEKLISN
jgi:UDP-N-acetylglucosamine--N-acetylmuramyl-(pentapeptide) pyrophosphoryl-undecaprenol N-acetylglucosamine transferase